MYTYVYMYVIKLHILKSPCLYIYIYIIFWVVGSAHYLTVCCKPYKMFLHWNQTKPIWKHPWISCSKHVINTARGLHTTNQEEPNGWTKVITRMLWTWTCYHSWPLTQTWSRRSCEEGQCEGLGKRFGPDVLCCLFFLVWSLQWLRAARVSFLCSLSRRMFYLLTSGFCLDSRRCWCMQNNRENWNMVRVINMTGTWCVKVTCVHMCVCTDKQSKA